MTEERSCKTCKLSMQNNGTGKLCGPIGFGDCTRFSKWQPIQKAPSFQMTEEEARVISKIVVCDSETCIYVDNDCVECRYYKLKQAGYIRKSSLVELVEEAEKILNNDSDYYTPHDIGIVAKGFKALKKDHPEFEGKK